ncbi:MAG: amino acid adenylation domain-containing protein [Cyanobacteria bacterium J06639_18]
MSYIVNDAQVSVLVTKEKWAIVESEHPMQVVCLDTQSEVISQQNEENPVSNVQANNLVYTIYTSGSTGKPKGVAIEHRSLVNFIQAALIEYDISASDRILQFASISFDAAAEEIYPCLSCGATLVLRTEEMLKSVPEFVQQSRDLQISVWDLPTAYWHLLCNELVSGHLMLPESLRMVIIGGERALPERMVMWYQSFGDSVSLMNSYGPTEATVVTTVCQLSAKRLDQGISVGRPINNILTYVLDRYLQPVPIGVQGELHIGGAGLARGYLNRPDLNEQKFIPSPFESSGEVNEKTGRLYKTGDLARYLPDGSIEFLGRIDNQVKLRGFRIELGEIEAVLSTHPEIQEVVVNVRAEQVDNKYLVAYIVPQQESLSTKKVRNFLRQKLPDYMVPSAFVILQALPLTPNGKIDRHALPTPDIEQNRQVEFVAPRTSTEEAIANIFASVLKLKRVGIHDNFFELGGHSLLATQVVSRLQQTFNIEFPLRSLLEFSTVVELSENLSKYRQAESESEALVPLPTVLPVPEQRYQPFPLTDIQQAYWLGRNEAFELGNIAAHGYIELDCQNLNLQRLNLAWQKLIDRHDMLRVVILPDGQQQVLEEVPPYKIELLDLCGQAPEVINAELEFIRDRMSHEVLRVDRFPLFEIRATRLDEVRTRLHLSFDALIADAWSVFVLGKEWTKLYENPELILPRLELSFRDYVLTELTLSDTPQYRRSQEYWFNRLDTLPPGAELPLAKNPSSITKPEFKRRSAQLSPSQWEKLKDRGNQFNLTASGVLLAAFAQILGRWSKSQKFTINLTLFNRLSVHPQINDILGDFTSLTLLEIDNSVPNSFGSNTFVNSAKKLQQQLWQDLDRASISAVKVQRELNRRRETYQIVPIVFTSTLGLESLGEGISMFEGLGEEVYSITQTPQVWLDNQVREKDGVLIFNWDGVEELFPAGLLDDMFGAYCDLLERLATSESAWLKERQQLLPPNQQSQRHEVNNTRAPIYQKTLHGLFIDRVKTQPQSLAVISSEENFTYEELYQKASALAVELKELGAIPNTLVAVVMEKGWRQVVAVLGILMSGAAYLPIDPALPQERQWYLLQQGQVKLVVTQSDLEKNLSLPSGVQNICVDNISNVETYQRLRRRQGSGTSLHDDTFLQDDENIENLAYVIYTSGSTGSPKGVAIDHRGAVNTIVDINQRFEVGNQDRVLALSALNFDLSVYDIFGILAAGGSIVIPPSDAVKDPAYWYELIVKHGVTIWNTVPALMQMLTEYLSVQPNTTPLSLRLALLSGDWLPLSLPEQIQSYCWDINVISLGGATEASIWSIYYPIETVNPNWKSIPYGKPLTNQQFYVLNELMEPTPVWVVGQLYIGGIGLAKGYWRDESKTNGSFITHPVTGERLYKTGDLGRYLPSGDIEFLGRSDFQVKINGYRIELGEIEATLKQHPAIKQVVVTTLGEEREKKSLIAYVIPEAQKNKNSEISNLTSSEMRRFVRAKLPEYMVPSVFMVLDSLPLTNNGKIDRRSLPLPDQTKPELEKTFVAPRNSIEKLLIETWTEIFKFEKIGIHDNFFELGGNSFLALQLISKINQKLKTNQNLKINQKFHTNISLSKIFQYPTVAELAVKITQTSDNSLVSSSLISRYLVPIQVEGTQPPLFCIHPAGGQVMVYQHLAAYLGTDRPIIGVQSRALDRPEQEHKTIDDMAIEYTQAIYQYQPHSPYYLMGWSMGGVIAVNVAKELEKQGHKVAFVGLVDSFLISDSLLNNAKNHAKNFNKRDPFMELALLFGGTFFDAFIALDPVEQQELREELINLNSHQRLQRIMIWGQKRNLLPTDISIDILEKQLAIAEIHDRLLKVHRSPQIEAPLHVWWASYQQDEGLSYTEWSKYTRSASFTKILDGNHFSIVHPPQIKTLAQQLQKCF